MIALLDEDENAVLEDEDDDVGDAHTQLLAGVFHWQVQPGFEQWPPGPAPRLVPQMYLQTPFPHVPLRHSVFEVHLSLTSFLEDEDDDVVANAPPRLIT